MPIVHLETVIKAPRERVFDLARSIDAHQDTASASGERAVAGVTSGLLGPDQEVTWAARHLGVRQRLRVRMSAFDRPHHFQDVMVEGAFRHLRHDHTFEEQGGGTLMIDRFDFSAPWGLLGRLAETWFLAAYLRRFLTGRNAVLKRMAESEEWRRYLSEIPPGGIRGSPRNRPNRL